MRYALALMGFMLAGCGTVSVGNVELTPEQRCLAYTGAVARYERILAEEGSLNDAQQVAYDVSLAGQFATCIPPE